MPYKFDMEDFDKKLVEKLKRQGMPPAPISPLADRIRRAVRKRKLPRLPRIGV